jgi:tetratricopeptide (TPR) repeat protein
MSIQPSISSASFATLDKVSYYSSDERETIFSVHTVFRIGDINEIEPGLWQIELALTSDDDQELVHLTKHIDHHIEGSTGLHRLGALMIDTQDYEKAEEIFSRILEQTSKDNVHELAALHHRLGLIKDRRQNSSDAQCHYEYSVRMGLACMYSDHSQLTLTNATRKELLSSNIEWKELSFALNSNLHATAAADDYDDRTRLIHRLVNISLVLNNHGKHTQAIDCCKCALAIDDDLHQHVQSEQERPIGKRLTMANHIIITSTFADKMLDMQSSSLLSNLIAMPMAHDYIARVLTRLHRYDEAREHAQRAVDTKHDNSKCNHFQEQDRVNYSEQLNLSED